MKRVRKRGATLIELMITVGVYTFIVLALFALTRDGTKGWKSIETRTQVQSQLRNFERDISEELKRTALDSIRFYGMNTGDSYKRGILMLSAMNNRDDVTVLGEPSSFWVDETKDPPEPKWQRWVLFYLTRPDRDEHVRTYGYACKSYDTNPAPDNLCPHKWLVRKDIYLSAMSANTKTQLTALSKDKLVEGSGSGRPFIEGNQGAGDEPTEAQLFALQTTSGSLVARTRILARDILSFSFNVLDAAGAPLPTPVNAKGAIKTGGKIVLFDVKAFKVTEAQGLISVGESDMSSSTFTVQLDNRVIPQNMAFP